MARALAAFLLLLLAGAALPSARAAPFVSDGETEPVSSWALWDDGAVCGSWDAVLGFVEVPTLTTFRHVESGGVTAYTLHLEPPAGAACPAFDLAFTSPAAWAQGWGQVSSLCGVTGEVGFFDHGDGVSVQLFMQVPAACDLPVEGRVTFGGNAPRLHADTAVVCMPYAPVGAACVGARDGPTPWWCPDGGAYTEVWPVLRAGDSCRWDRPGERSVTASLVVASAGVRTTDEACVVYVEDQFNGGSLVEEPCPEGVREPVHGLPWGRLLP